MLIDRTSRADDVQDGENEGEKPSGEHHPLGAEINIPGHWGTGKAQRTRLKHSFPLGTGEASTLQLLCVNCVTKMQGLWSEASVGCND